MACPSFVILWKNPVITDESLLIWDKDVKDGIRKGLELRRKKLDLSDGDALRYAVS